MNKKLLTKGVILGALALVPVSSFAAGFGRGELTEDQIAEKEAKRAEMVQILEAGDYSDWYNFVTSERDEPKIIEYINEENFDEYSEMKLKMHEAKELMKEAKEMREELGLPSWREGKMKHRSQK